MSAETRSCQHCQQPFLIEVEDFDWYRKIDVPPPTWCPECRKQRRLSWRNDMNLYSRKCDLCGKNTVSIYAPNGPIKTVYCQKCWWSDKWDPRSYARDYDPKRSFFKQFAELQQTVPALAMINDDGIMSMNCEYTQDFARSKNCYMVFIAWKLEDCMNSFYILDGKEIFDSLNSMGECQSIYETVQIEKCYQCRNVYQSIALTDCQFMWDCRDCSDCFMCVGLRHKKYCFKNIQYTKEEYKKILAEYRLDTASGVERAWQEFEPMLTRYPRKPFEFYNCVNCTGDQLINGKNSKHCFNVARPEDCKWVEDADTPKDSHDLTVGGELDQCYESITADHSYRSRFSIFSWKNTETFYLDACHSSKDIFGCVGVKKAQYCILNKQYSKEEYVKLAAQIRQDMDANPYLDKAGIKYGFGEFFPAELSYFAYNESSAYGAFPISEKDAAAKNLRWQDKFQLTTGQETIQPDAIPDSIRDVQDSITKETLRCAECSRNYRIIPQELSFYRKMSIPIPRRCFYCRAKTRFALQNPYKLWSRKCMCAGGESENGVFKNTAAAHPSHAPGEPCPNKFETSYAPGRPEIIYCEQCYNSEIA